MKSASAPPRGGAREPSSYYWCSIRIVLIDYQSKRRDVRTAAQSRRCNMVVVKNFRWEGEPQRRFRNTTLNIRIRSIQITASTFSVPPPPSIQYKYTIRHGTYTLQLNHIRLVGGKPAISLLSTRFLSPIA